MGDAIAHRGPDGEGFHVEGGIPAVGLVSRRLAVIDVEHGAQPMSIEDGAFTIVYNGEIFNAHELRRELEGRGHRFSTLCDTEVVLRGYATWGANVLQRLNGMWALAIWDRSARRLFLARDRLGVKPLVYARTPLGLVFASEIKAVLASGLVDRELDLTGLPQYLSAFAVPDPLTLLRGVRRLPAAHFLTADEHGVREHEYWDCALEEDEDRGADAVAEDVGELLSDAVRRRLVSDVPLGVLLSGGVDSRLIAAYAARGASSPLRTFTLGFDGGAADERDAARRVATALGTRHHEDVLAGREAAALLPALIEAYDEPGQSLVQSYVVSRFARREVTVALSGIGGDELFAAYPTHVAANMLARIDGLPHVARAAVRAGAAFAPHPRVRRAGELAAMSPRDRVARALMDLAPAQMRAALLNEEVREAVDLEAPARRLAALYDRAGGRDELNRILYVFVKTYLPDELLRATDAMSMWNSLEIRTPFLDYRLVELAMRVPARHKLRWQQGKLVLRGLDRELLGLPPSGAKRGFSPPLGAWLRGPLRERVREALSPETICRRGVFDPDAAGDVLERALAGDERLVAPVMMLFAFETWARRGLDVANPVPASPLPMSIDTLPVDVSVIVVSWNTRELLRDCLASVAEHLAGVEHEVIVVDNASHDGSAEMVAADFPAALVIRNAENTGFGSANNQGMRIARGRWLLLLNSDAALTDGSIADLFARLDREGYDGVAHCRLRLPDGRLQHSAYRFPSLRLALLEDLGLRKLLPGRRAGDTLLGAYWDHGAQRDVDWVAGAFMLLPREIFLRIGGFDARIFMYGEDLEWCHRISEHGWPIRYFPEAEVLHRDHASADQRFGSARESLCLRHRQEFYVAHHGRAAGLAYLVVRILGAALRLGYHLARERIGPRADDYREMRPQVQANLLAMLTLARRRR